MFRTWRVSIRVLVVAAMAGALVPGRAAFGENWYKGNTHAHTWWSDGDSPPEMTVEWYKEHGYQFLVLSDHNILSEGEKWVTAEKKREEPAAVYESRFAGRLVKREKEGKTEYRLKTLVELKQAYEQPGKFLLVPGEEITTHLGKLPVHLNGFNLREVVPPQVGSSVLEIMQLSIDAVLAQRKATGQPMFPHVNHPNFRWGITAEDMAPLRGEQFFEVFNGHRGSGNYGDEDHPNTERIWDVVLTRRLAELNLPVMYGMATDDTHSLTVKSSLPGRGWVMVRAEKLAPESLVVAMEKGDFYPTSGVLFKSVAFDGKKLRIQVDPRQGVEYKIQFIGTMKGYDKTVTTRPAADGSVAYEYSKDIGKVLSEQAGPEAGYELTGKEIYVRGKVISTAAHPNPHADGDMEVAWTQPVKPGKH